MRKNLKEFDTNCLGLVLALLFFCIFCVIELIAGVIFLSRLFFGLAFSIQFLIFGVTFLCYEKKYDMALILIGSGLGFFFLVLEYKTIAVLFITVGFISIILSYKKEIKKSQRDIDKDGPRTNN